MNIYKIERLTKCGFDAYSEFVCFAENEEIAENMHPTGYTIDWKQIRERLKQITIDYLADPWFNGTPEDEMEEIIISNGWVTKKSNIKVKLLGNGIKDSKREVICY
jgi:hypothetical protein